MHCGGGVRAVTPTRLAANPVKTAKTAPYEYVFAERQQLQCSDEFFSQWAGG